VDIKIFQEKQALAKAAANDAAAIIRNSITQRSRARIIAATGASQFEFLEVLTGLPEIDWGHVEMFHLDEYVGIPETHPASFCKYLRERLIDKAGVGQYHLLNGTGGPAAVIREVGQKLRREPIDVAFVGVGENGHLAFNDPPADFDTDEPYAVVALDEACRRQQLNEGWFSNLDDIPKHAISMTIRQILKANNILCIVPDERKARAVKNCFDGEVSPMAPASALQRHRATIVYLDRLSSSLLNPDVRVERI
jgi:glucosamine-6-phosphate deaminase